MKSSHSEFSTEYLAFIKKVFSKRYKQPLTEEQILTIARNLSRFGAVCHNFTSKKQGRQPIYSI